MQDTLLGYPARYLGQLNSSHYLLCPKSIQLRYYNKARRGGCSTDYDSNSLPLRLILHEKRTHYVLLFILCPLKRFLSNGLKLAKYTDWLWHSQ